MLEDGDTLVRNEAVLAPGFSVAGVVQSPDDTLSIVTLDVEPDTTVTLGWTTDSYDVWLGLKDGDGGTVVPVNEDPAGDSFATFDLTGRPGPFFVPLLASRYLPEGSSYTLTLAEGDEPLAPADATPSTAGVTQTTPSGSDQPRAGNAGSMAGCSVSSTSDVNQRSGPGTDFERAGVLAGGISAVVDGQATGSDGFVWWRIGEGLWVRSDVVSETGSCEGVAVVLP